MKPVLFTGAGVAIVTPFHADGSVNYDMLGTLVEYQIAGGADAILPCGTTGESPTLSHEEHAQVIRFTVEKVAGRLPVIAGTGSNDTAYCVKLSKEAEAAGADGLLLVTPYYNKTSQAGLIAHFTHIADRVGIPMMLYNVPSRTGLNILPETYQVLSRHERIVAVKEANGDISALAKTAALCGDDLALYTGNDDQITAFLSLCGKGVVSVLANICPGIAHDIVARYLQGDTKGSCALQLEYLDLCNDLFIDVNPIPVKTAMQMMGWEVGPCRMPLAPMSDSARERLRSVLERHGLFNK